MKVDLMCVCHCLEMIVQNHFVVDKPAVVFILANSKLRKFYLTYIATGHITKVINRSQPEEDEINYQSLFFV